MNIDSLVPLVALLLAVLPFAVAVYYVRALRRLGDGDTTLRVPHPPPQLARVLTFVSIAWVLFIAIALIATCGLPS